MKKEILSHNGTCFMQEKDEEERNAEIHNKYCHLFCHLCNFQTWNPFSRNEFLFLFDSTEDAQEIIIKSLLKGLVEIKKGSDNP